MRYKGRMKRLLLIPLFLVACQASQKSPEQEKIGKSGLTVAEARLTIEDLAASLNTAVQLAAIDIASRTKDLKRRRLLVVWQVRTKEVTRLALSQADPRWAFLDIWTYAIQMRNYLEKEKLFGEETHVAATAIRQAEQDIDDRAKAVVPKDIYEETHASVEKYAAENELTGDGARPSFVTVRAGGEGAFAKIAKAPLEVLKIGGGVKDTAMAINKIGKVADRLVTVADDLPLQIRWETQLLLYDLNDNPGIARLLDDADAVAESIAGVAKTVEKLPSRVGDEVKETLKQVEDQQEELRKTIKDVRGVVDETNATVQNTQAALKEAKATIDTVNEAAKSLTKTGEAWKPAFEELNKIVNPPKDPDAVPGPPLDFKDVVKASGNFTDTAVEIRGALKELRELIGSNDLKGAVGQATESAGTLVTHIMLMVMGVIVVFFVCLFAYKKAIGS